LAWFLVGVALSLIVYNYLMDSEVRFVFYLLCNSVMMVRFAWWKN
jgi:hypothetical protein